MNKGFSMRGIIFSTKFRNTYIVKKVWGYLEEILLVFNAGLRLQLETDG